LPSTLSSIVYLNPDGVSGKRPTSFGRCVCEFSMASMILVQLGSKLLLIGVEELLMIKLHNLPLLLE
jgi:hypothetical protein